MSELRDQLDKLSTQLKNTEESKGWFERRLNETQV